MNIEMEAIAPPKTAELLESDACKYVFARLANAALMHNFVISDSEHFPMLPNRIAVAPFIQDNSVQYLIESSVELPGGGRTQVQQNSISKIILGEGINSSCIIIDNDSGEQLANLGTSSNVVALGVTALVYTVEAYCDPDPEMPL